MDILGKEGGTGGSAELTTLFCLPFVFRPIDNTEVATPTRLRGIRTEIIAALEADLLAGADVASCSWQLADPAEYLSSIAHYDERRYLHPFARDVLTNQSFLTLARAPWPHGLDGGTELSLEDSKGNWTKGLRLVGCQVHLFDAGVGVLSIEVDGQGSPADLLKFNEGFRRIGRSYVEQDWLPRSVSLAGAEYSLFEPVGAWQDEERSPPDTPASLLSEQWLIRLLIGSRLGPGAASDRKWTVEPVLDERMVVITWMGHRACTEFSIDSLWQQLLFVDSSANGSYDTSANDPFMKHLREGSEYRRWWNTHRIGFTRYSAAFLGRVDDSFFAKTIRNQVRRVYYTIGLMMLLHRAKLLEFSRLSSTLSKAIAEARPSRTRTIHDNVRRLRESFLDFATRYWFIELTNQDQGIDMTEKWSSALRNRQLFAEVQEEIERFEALQTQRAADRTNFTLQSLSFFLTIVALWTGFLGANIAWPVMVQPPTLGNCEPANVVSFLAAFAVLVPVVAIVGTAAYALSLVASRRHR